MNFLNPVIESLTIWWQLAKPFFEIALLWFVIYHIMLFFEGTGAIQVLRGIIILLLAFFLFQKLGLDRLDWLLTKLFGISVIVILIVFHPEIRRGLARLGQRHFFGTTLKEQEFEVILGEIMKAVDSLSKDKIGALIAIERNDPLSAYIESGVILDAAVSSDLIQTVFAPNTLLHDGGMVIQHGRIMAAGCLFPLTQNQELGRIFGMRHRAALGLSQETDAVVIIVSEERHDISLVYQSRLLKDLSREEVFIKIKEIVRSEK